MTIAIFAGWRRSRSAIRDDREQHGSGLLGARRAGTGKRPRLRFEPSVVAAALRDAQAAAEREPDLGNLEVHVPRVRSKA
jgi:hypothetical protein